METLFGSHFITRREDLFLAKLGQGAKFQGWIDISQRKGRISIGRATSTSAGSVNFPWPTTRN